MTFSITTEKIGIDFSIRSEFKNQNEFELHLISRKCVSISHSSEEKVVKRIQNINHNLFLLIAL